jgi:hypothetical protein
MKIAVQPDFDVRVAETTQILLVSEQVHAPHKSWRQYMRNICAMAGSSCATEPRADAQTRGDRGLQAPGDWLFDPDLRVFSEAIVTTPTGVPALKALHND